jgi:hypothetical protein
VLLKRFELTIRPTDVFLSTFPKCGTTLIQNLLYQLRQGGDPHVDCTLMLQQVLAQPYWERKLTP